MIPRGKALPTLNSIEIEKNEITIKQQNKSKEEILNIISNTPGSVGKITSQVLFDAPYDFFFEFDDYVKRLVGEIQTIMAEDGTAESIAKTQENPDDLSLKKTTRHNINNALTRFTNSSKGVQMFRTVDDKQKKVINAMAMNELIGLGPLEPLWNDTKITEIIANGPFDIQVEISGQIHQVSSCHFRNADQLLDLINRLYGSINKQITRTNPMEKGRLHDKSRMHAVHQIVAPDGPNFNIRRHSDEYVTPKQIINYGTANEELMKFLGNLIYAGVSFLVIGGTGTGKTTLLDALTAYVREDKRCISIEENLEMKPHPNKLFAAAMECIPPKPGALNDKGITMRDLVRASLQMRPETIFIGEVSDSAAYDLCQALNTGHDGASTVHANSPEDAMYRLMSLVSQSALVKEHAAYDLIASAFDIIICVERFPMDGSRKIVSIGEVGGKTVKDDEGNRILPVIPLWKFEPDQIIDSENPKVTGEWVQVNELSEKTRKKHYLDIKPELSWNELQEVARIKK